ncbi:vegetative cell wall protein gp1-like [Arachis ipaensis]|uniref:vegetative cell wall protein gp1-like n=1 Tax=Arachis ipaensis TaxID=130454 RepID=UPI0007AFDD07|nr:vegetative cell wall protein gp1-like [Arachis ipaensis]
MGADAHGAGARQFKNRDNPSSRGTLRSRAPQPPPPSSSSPRPIYPRSRVTGRRRATLIAGDSPCSTSPSLPPPPHPFSLSHSSLPLPPLNRAVTNPSAATPSSLPAARSSLFVLPTHPHILLPSRHHPPPPFRLFSLRPNHRATAPPFTALPPLPDSPASDELDHQEEDAEAPVQQDAPDTTEPPRTQEEPVPQPDPQPQTEPEPIVAPPTDPPV